MSTIWFQLFSFSVWMPLSHAYRIWGTPFLRVTAAFSLGAPGGSGQHTHRSERLGYSARDHRVLLHRLWNACAFIEGTSVLCSSKHSFQLHFPSATCRSGLYRAHCAVGQLEGSVYYFRETSTFWRQGRWTIDAGKCFELGASELSHFFYCQMFVWPVFPPKHLFHLQQ